MAIFMELYSWWLITAQGIPAWVSITASCSARVDFGSGIAKEMNRHTKMMTAPISSRSPVFHTDRFIFTGLMMTRSGTITTEPTR